MLINLRRSIVFAFVCLVLLGFIYGLAGTGLAQLAFHHQADGSITTNGSTLIGQNWNDGSTTVIKNHQWFHGRPDADDPLKANGTAGESGASNLGPRSKTLVRDTRELVRAWHQVGVDPTADLVTTSGSGLDPDITRQDAMVQIPMVARARHLSAPTLRSLVGRQTQSAELGFLGSDYVNVMQLNEALARLH